MNISSQISRVANFAILLLAVVTLSSCSKPSGNALKQGILANAQIRNPAIFFGTTVILKDYEVTNQYKQDDIYIYEYKATMLVTDHTKLDLNGNVVRDDDPQSWDYKVEGRIGFQKLGNRWDLRSM